MADPTGSRYGIVAALTNKKLELMDQREGLNNDLLEAEQAYNIAKSHAQADKDAIKANAKKLCDKVDRDVETYKNALDNLKAGLTDKAKNYNCKIAAVDAALKNIAEISKSQSTEQNSEDKQPSK